MWDIHALCSPNRDDHNARMEPSHVLVVDDDEGVRSAMAELLEGHGFTVRQAENGRVAIRMAGEQRPAIILLDLSMPVLDGWSTLEELVRHPDLWSVPVVVITAESSPPHGVPVIKKPADVDRVLDVVQTAVHGRRAAVRSPANPLQVPRERHYGATQHR